NCTNPLFAATLPTGPGQELCGLPRGPRTSDLVFFALIGGVPWQLLTENPSDMSNGNKAAFKTALDPSDWTRILGADPAKYDFTGIDGHMIESVDKRAGMANDDAHSREWDTQNRDLQFACTFPFPNTPSSPQGRKDCTDNKFKGACDCDGSNPDSPLCDTASPNVQVKGKAYPTV